MSTTSRKMNGLHSSKPSQFTPSLNQVIDLLESKTGNCIPVYTTLPADILTPVLAYLKLTDGARLDGSPSFLLESILEGSYQARYSFVGTDPFKIIRTGATYGYQGDPLVPLQQELDQYKMIPVSGIPSFTGGAIGYVAYDCVRYFEPKTARTLKDPLDIPESLFMLCDTIVAFDHLFQTIKVISHVFYPEISTSSHASSTQPTLPSTEIQNLYEAATNRISKVVALLTSTSNVPLPEQPEIPLESPQAVSNIGEAGYKAHVRRLKEYIVKGDIIQAVPSQRLARPTALHPFNAYRHLRQVNPSPYMFYINCGENTQLVGASPECLCKVDNNVVTNHAIAGTVKRGANPEEDERLANELKQSPKDRAEHIMLVDLARNDVNRVCEPASVKVDSLMRLERFSHVIHLTSQISGKLRQGKTRFDAFRSIFPAGTVSGAPKIRAMELIAELEGERRGVYAGAVGHWNFASDAMDTCIAIRTMTFKNGVAYLQAGGGIVFDSSEDAEYTETLDKLSGNVKALAQAEEYYA